MASVGELWLADFGEPFPGEPAHRRPALVVGPDAVFGGDLPFVIVCPLTTAQRGLSVHIEVEPSGQTGLDDVSYVQCELVRSVSSRRLVHPFGSVDGATWRSVDHVLRVLLGH